MKLTKIERGLQELLEAAKGHPIGRSKHIEGGGINAYIRVSKRLVDGSYQFGITIASVDVTLRFQRKGRFKALLALCDDFAKKNDLAFVYVESVVNEHLLAYLLTQGFKPHYPNLMLGGDFYRLNG